MNMSRADMQLMMAFCASGVKSRHSVKVYGLKRTKLCGTEQNPSLGEPASYRIGIPHQYLERYVCYSG